MNYIIHVVSEVTGKDPKEICRNKRRCRNVSRELVIYIAKNNYAYQLAEIAECLNMNACSSVSAASNRTSRRMKVNPGYENLYDQCLEVIQDEYIDSE